MIGHSAVMRDIKNRLPATFPQVSTMLTKGPAAESNRRPSHYELAEACPLGCLKVLRRIQNRNQAFFVSTLVFGCFWVSF